MLGPHMLTIRNRLLKLRMCTGSYSDLVNEQCSKNEIQPANVLLLWKLKIIKWDIVDVYLLGEPLLSIEFTYILRAFIKVPLPNACVQDFNNDTFLSGSGRKNP